MEEIITSVQSKTGVVFYITTAIAMVLGNITHVVKKVVEVRKVDGTFSIVKYVTMYPYKTYMIIMAGVGGYLTLLSTGGLGYETAFMAGFIANSLGGIEADGAKT